MAEPVFVNPVFAGAFPDPFVIEHGGEYWAFCTGLWHDDRVFGVLRSRDLVNWSEAAGAMEQLSERPPHYWAPEVVYDNGRFYLYYSAGDEVHMHLRVAVAYDPGGPYVDSGTRLTSEQFAIDAHVFVDADGSRYMFYATDFLEHTHVGTGTVVDRMLGPFELEGRPRPVTRARFDWQVYDPNRKEKGGVRWHTVEGPFVLERKGRYYEMFSGGNWQNTTYGVSYATSDRILSDDEWEQTCDGERVVPILRTIPERVVGPGHNSVVIGPDGWQRYCVYHLWTVAGRSPAIDRLEWIGDRLAVLGPTYQLQPAPLRPRVSGFERAAAPGRPDARWATIAGEWSIGRDLATADASGRAEIAHGLDSRSVAVDVSLRCRGGEPNQGFVGVELQGGGGAALRVGIDRDARAVSIRWVDQGEAGGEEVPLGPDFAFGALHGVRIEIDSGSASVAVDDGRTARWRGRLGVAPDRVALVAERVPAEFVGFSLVYGWSDELVDDGEGPATRGWRVDAGTWTRAGVELGGAGRARARLSKPIDVDSYELVVNARVVAGDGSYIIEPASGPDDGPVFRVEERDGLWALVGDSERFPLGAPFDPRVYHQFRFRKLGASIEVSIEGHRLGAVGAPPSPIEIALGAYESEVAFDLVRLTEIVAEETEAR